MEMCTTFPILVHYIIVVNPCRPIRAGCGALPAVFIAVLRVGVFPGAAPAGAILCRAAQADALIVDGDPRGRVSLGVGWRRLCCCMFDNRRFILERAPYAYTRWLRRNTSALSFRHGSRGVHPIRSVSTRAAAAAAAACKTYRGFAVNARGDLVGGGRAEEAHGVPGAVRPERRVGAG